MRKNLVDNILSPRYYNPEVSNTMKELKKSHDIISVGELLSQKS